MGSSIYTNYLILFEVPQTSNKLPQTLKSRQNSSIDMTLNTVKNCNFMSILQSKPLREYKKPTFKIGDRLRISKYDLPFRKNYKPQFT